MIATSANDSSEEFESTNYYKVFIWDAATGELLRKLGGQSARPYNIRFSSDQKYIASVGETLAWGRALVWDAQTGETLLSVSKVQADSVALAFFPTNRLVAYGDDNGIQIWDLPTSNLVYRIHTAVNSQELASRAVSALAISSDSRKVAVGRMDGSVAVFDLPLPATLEMTSADLKHLNLSFCGCLLCRTHSAPPLISKPGTSSPTSPRQHLRIESRFQ